MSNFWDDLSQDFSQSFSSAFSHWDEYPQVFSDWFGKEIRRPQFYIELLELFVSFGVSDAFTGLEGADPFTTVADSSGGGTADSFTNQSLGNGDFADPYGSGGDTPSAGGGDTPTAHPMVAAALPADGVGSPALGTIEVNGSAELPDEPTVTGVFKGESYDTYYYSDGTISYVSHDGGTISTTFGEMKIERLPPGTPLTLPPDFVPEPAEPVAVTQTSPGAGPAAPQTPAPAPTGPPVVQDQTTAPPALPPTPPPPPTPPAPEQSNQGASPPASPQAGSGTASYDPMANSPFTKWLLYGSNTPVRDFVTNDANLREVQNAALGISTAAATIATGGMLLEAAPVIFGGLGASAAGSVSAGAPLAAGAAGILATNPGIADELEEGVESSLPALGAELEEILPSTAEQAATRFQDIVRQAHTLLSANKDLVMELGGSSKGAPISSNQLGAAIGQYAKGNPGFARALGGNALEAVVNAIIEDLPPSEGSFMQISGPNRIDFVGTGSFQGYTFELTSEAGVAGHALRAYMQEAGSMIFTYTPIID